MTSKTGKIIAVNISTEKGTVKKSVPEITIDNQGINGDAHAGNWHRQISILNQASLNQFKRQIKPGEFAENLTITGIDLTKTAILDRFQIGEVELELTQIGKECHGEGCAVYREIGKCAMPKEGIFCRVIKGGTIKPNTTIEYIPRLLTIKLITLSDRAFAGEYEDKSGIIAKEILEKFFADKRWHLEIKTAILPDDAQQLTTILNQDLQNKTDIIFTLGGTGVGHRDITPEVVSNICEKTIPGIMEHIRFKYGATKPNARLSRSVAGINNTTQIYVLPGSVKAVQEYLPEILTTLEHIIFMLYGIDIH